MYVVIPCYNEEQMLPITAEALIKKLDELKAEGRIAQNSKVMFVDDGSKDKTWEIIQKLHEASPVFTGLKLSRNGYRFQAWNCSGILQAFGAYGR